MNSFAIIGGGASGIILAANLLKLDPTVWINIIESSGNFGAGVAYSTDDPMHLLNVRTHNMSAFADDHDHFLHWLQKNYPLEDYTEGDFAPRRLYRYYLNEILNELLKNSRVTLYHERVTAIQHTKDSMAAMTVTGINIFSDAVILATGNEPASANISHHIIDPWIDHKACMPAKNDPIIILGTGLTMIDSVITLLNQGHTGEITALSRRGLLPHVHKTSSAIKLERSELAPEKGILFLFRQIRQLIEQHRGNWRGVIDAMRPYNAQLWQALSVADKNRFLRHLRPWWDTYRHRMAPTVAKQISEAIESGQLHIIAGRANSIVEKHGVVTVKYQERNTQQLQTITAPLLIDCRGGNAKLSQTSNPAIQSLLQQHYGQPDALDLGLAVNDNLQLIPMNGTPQMPIFAIGPVTKGIYWEVTAIPDIRNEAKRLANYLTQSASTSD